MAGLDWALFAEPIPGDINRRNTHVEAVAKGSQDAGSIPAASIRLAALAHGRPSESFDFGRARGFILRMSSESNALSLSRLTLSKGRRAFFRLRGRRK